MSYYNLGITLFILIIATPQWGGSDTGKPPVQPASAATKESKGRQAGAVISSGKDPYIVRAQRHYNCGDLIEAEQSVKNSLKIRPLNVPALEMQKKINHLKDVIEQGKLRIAQEYYHSAEYLAYKGFLLDAMLDIKRSLILSPDNKAAFALYGKIVNNLKKISENVEPDSRKDFKNAVQCYVDGDIAESLRLFRSLQDRIEESELFLPTVLAHISDDSNRISSNKYFHQAFRALRDCRLKTAQDNLYLALSVDKDNLDAKILLIQVEEMQRNN